MIASMYRSLLPLVFILLVAGCTTETRSASVERTSGVQNGQPVELVTVREERGKTETTADIGPLVNAAVAAAMGDVRGALKGVAEQVGALQARPAGVQADEVARLIATAGKEAGFDPTTGAALGGAGGLLLLALREMLAARAHKRDADEGWELAMKNAKTPEVKS
jgi:hypothetical protein